MDASLENKKVAGLLLIIGSIISILGIIVSEALYPGYSTSKNYISDLGVGPSANIFNSSLVILGLLIFGSVYFLSKSSKNKIFLALLCLAGVGAIGVGMFTEEAGVLHGIFSLIVFLFGGLAAIASYKLQEPPTSYFSVILGVMVLLALMLFTSHNYLNLGKGGMERLIAYPALLWGIVFGGYLTGEGSKE